MTSFGVVDGSSPNPHLHKCRVFAVARPSLPAARSLRYSAAALYLIRKDNI